MSTLGDLGYNSFLYRGYDGQDTTPGLASVGVTMSSGTITSPISDALTPSTVVSGSLDDILFSGKKSFTDTTSGFRMGKDPIDAIYKWIVGGSSGSIDWSVTTNATLTITGVGIVSPTISYGKTSFSDSTNAGYYISAAGIYVGAASDASKLKYTVADGTFDFIGTVSSRSTLTIANAINSGGNLVTDIINARLDSSAKKILAGFNFGTADYSGALNAGNVTWNTTTGAITGGSGVVVYRAGIVGVNAGVTTFSIDATTGAATFAGTLSAPGGILGGFALAATTITATNLVFTSGSSNVANITVGTGANAGGLNSAAAGTDIAFWAGSSYANRATAPFRVNAQGDLVATSVTTLTLAALVKNFTAGEALTVGDAIAVGDGTSYDNIITQATGSTQTSNNNWYAQTFLTGSAVKTVTKVILKIAGNSNAETPSISIRATAAGVPTGADIGGYTASQSVPSGGAAEVTFTFATPVPVSPNTTYAIILRGINYGGSHDETLIYANSDVYANGQMCNSTDSGSTWAAFGTNDMYFKLSFVLTVAGSVYRTNAAVSTDLSNNFIGFSTVTVAASATAAIAIGGVNNNLTSLTIGSTYYLSNTVGAIATSAGTVSKKVGLAISTTELLIKFDNP